eukprot:Skav227977  [mRNA]  locus=scaffold1165:12397:13688:+ [translate_table: standard]
MVPEFIKVLQQPASEPLPPHSRQLRTPFRGYIASAGTQQHFQGCEQDNTHGDLSAVGIHSCPNEFVQEALIVGHPTEAQAVFPSCVGKVVDETLSQSHESIAKERTADLRRWATLITDLKDREELLRSSMSQRKSAMLKDKKLALFEKLILESGHQDVGLIQDLTRGFDLIGELPKSGVFDRPLRPAKISCDNLWTCAKVSRDSILKTVSSSGEGKPRLKKQKNKIRPIDDYKANMVVTIHAIDHIASMVAYWLRASSSLNGRAELVAKCWDLSDPYKQIPLSDEAYRRDAFLAVYCPDSQKAEVFRQKVTPFGSIASVTAFLRVSLALWAVGNSKLKLAWSAHFDDFLSLCEKASSKHTDLCISAMFSFLGWKLSEDKLLPFDSVCKFLGFVWTWATQSLA